MTKTGSAKTGSSPSRGDLGEDPPNRILGIAAILLATAIVALLIGGGVYWLTGSGGGPAVGGGADLPVAPTSVDHIELRPGALKDWNVLLISSDTTRADHVGCYGNFKIRTPVIDGLARQGVMFRQAITPVPITLPAHTSMLTGLNPPRHGVRSNGLFRLEAGVETLATRLKKNGYATAAAVGAYVLDAKFGLNQGFDTYMDQLGGTGSATQFGYPERPGSGVTADAVNWIRKHAKEKFLFFAHYFDPHFPYKPPPPYEQEYLSNPYDGEIAYVDAEVGKLVSLLDELGLRSRTLVVFTGDHGESLGEHGETTHAIFIYDATQHVPLVFSAPGPFPQNRVINNQVGLIDIVPTILSMVGAPVPKDLDGVSLLDPTSSSRGMYIETLYPKLTHRWAPLLGVRRSDFKFIYAPRPEIYDLRADPREMNNLYESRRALGNDMYGMLKSFLGGDPATATDVQGNVAVTEETRSRLRALGYVTAAPSSRPATTRTALPDPKDMIIANAHLVEAQNMIIAGRYEEAETHIERYLQASPDDPEGVQMAGRICRQLGRLDEALTFYRRAVSLGHEPAEAWSGIGSVWVLKKECDKAEQAYKRALEIDPRTTTALIGMGSVCSFKGQDKEALRWYQDALKYGGGVNAGMAYLGISAIHRKAGRTREAEEMLAKALEAEPTNPVLLKVAASLSEGAGNPAEAIERLRRAADAQPTEDVLLQLGRLLNAGNRYQEAAGYLRKGVSINAANADMQHELGTALLGLNQVQEAAEAFKRAIQANPRHSAALSQLGILFARAGKFKESEALMRQAVSADPKSYSAHYNLGLVLANQSRWGEALGSLRQALALEPGSARTRCKVGLVLDKMGKRDEAIAEYRKALELDPANAEAKEALTALGVRP